MDDFVDEIAAIERQIGLDSWLVMARDAFTQSTDWFDASLRKSLETSYAHFSGVHAPGSKYHSETYKFRSKAFRPKTRAMMRRNETAAAVAFFSTSDVVSITAENSAIPEQVESAKLLTELLAYRLDDSIPWFQTLIGAFQDTLNAGVCISHQTWEYKEETSEREVVFTAESGEEVRTTEREVVGIELDSPRVDLVPIENFRISPASNWVDPVGTSPYVIELMPVTVGEIKERMRAGVWLALDVGEIKLAASSQYDSVRQAREGKRQDNNDVTYGTSDFDTVFVHRNIVRKDGIDWLFYSLGAEKMLSEPVPLLSVYRHLRNGERPYVMGYSVLEAHKPFPCGLNEIVSSLQISVNEIENQRRDNISLILNKRYFARRSANIDYKSLTRNVPGSVTLMDDINQDIRWDSPGEITGSSYHEQDRANLDFDEIAGTFSPGSVASNRKLGETVGGMEMLNSDANSIIEYQLRTFAATWVLPVLKQLVRLEQTYEDDRVVLALAASRAKIDAPMEMIGQSAEVDALLKGMVTVKVGAGFGSTNPQQRITRLLSGVQAIAQLSPAAIARLDEGQIISEIMGAIGYDDGERFFKPAEEVQPQPPQVMPQVQAAQIRAEAEIQKAQAKIESDERAEMQRMAFEAAEADKNRALEAYFKELEAGIEQMKLQGQSRIGLDKLKAMMAETSMKLNVQRELSTAKQVMQPPTEPVGTARPGRAYQE